jgi:protein O-GlcNAc transferase
MPDEQGLAKLLAKAADCVNAGNLPLAEIICREILTSIPNCAQALALLGIIAAKLRLCDPAIDYFQRAIICDPKLESVRQDLHSIQDLPAQNFDRPSDRGDRFLLIKAWGHGFWADVNHVLGCLLLAEITGRIPVTYWGSNSLYSTEANGDAFQSYFEPVSAIQADMLLKMKEAAIFPPKWTNANLQGNDIAKYIGEHSRMAGFYFLNRPENIAVADYYIGVFDLLPWIPKTHRLRGKSVDDLMRYLIAKYLRPKPHILSAVEDIVRDQLGKAPVIAVHIRGSDKDVETPDVDEVNKKYFSHIDRQDKAWNILLLTDDTRLVEAFRKNYADRIFLTDCQRSSNHLGIHHTPSADRGRLGFEIMRDTYLALRCQKFIGNGQSAVSAMIAILKKWEAGNCILLMPSSFIHTQNWYLFDPAFKG